MNTKEILKTLLKIAQDQQKMIEKLAQFSPSGLKGDPLDPTLPEYRSIDRSLPTSGIKTNQPQLTPQHLQPGTPNLHPADLVMNTLPANVKAAVQHIVAKGNVLEVSFKAGMASQMLLNAIIKVVQDLVSKNKLSFSYTVKAV